MRNSRAYSFMKGLRHNRSALSWCKSNSQGPATRLCRLASLLAAASLVMVPGAGAAGAVRQPANDPLVASIDLTPPFLGPQGGTVEVDAILNSITGCQLKLTSSHLWPVVYPKASVPCGNTFTGDISIGANPAPVDRVASFDLVASDGNEVQRAPFQVVVLDAARTPYVSRATTANWSGYAVEGGPFTTVQGTFVVPRGSGRDCRAYFGQWLGIDGASNQDLIQAGVMEDELNPVTGQCTPGHVWVYPWWEIIPAPEVPIAGMAVKFGDSITVKISEVTAGHWVILVLDGTSRRSFRIATPYSGLAANAEWIVEAPCVGEVIAPLLYYGHAAFTGLQLGNATSAHFIQAMSLNDGHLVSLPQTVPSLAYLLQGFALVEI